MGFLPSVSSVWYEMIHERCTCKQCSKPGSEEGKY